jgi:hypothetical protein
LLVIAGALGLLAMFQPMVALGRGPVKVTTSAYDLSFGFAKLHKTLDRKLPGFAEKRLPADVRETRDDIKTVADASRGAAFAYVPCALLLVLGLISISRRRTPLGVAIAASVLGLLSIAAWFGVRYGIAYGIEEEPALQRLHRDLQYGAHVLLVAGLITIVAAVLALRERRH